MRHAQPELKVRALPPAPSGANEQRLDLRLAIVPLHPSQADLAKLEETKLPLLSASSALRQPAVGMRRAAKAHDRPRLSSVSVEHQG